MVYILAFFALIVLALTGLALVRHGWLMHSQVSPLFIELADADLLSYTASEAPQCSKWARLLAPVRYNAHELIFKLTAREEDENLGIYVLELVNDAQPAHSFTPDPEAGNIFQVKFPYRQYLSKVAAGYEEENDTLCLTFFCQTPFSFLHRNMVCYDLVINLDDEEEEEQPQMRKGSLKLVVNNTGKTPGQPLTVH